MLQFKFILGEKKKQQITNTLPRMHLMKCSGKIPLTNQVKYNQRNVSTGKCKSLAWMLVLTSNPPETSPWFSYQQYNSYQGNRTGGRGGRESHSNFLSMWMLEGKKYFKIIAEYTENIHNPLLMWAYAIIGSHSFLIYFSSDGCYTFFICSKCRINYAKSGKSCQCAWFAWFMPVTEFGLIWHHIWVLSTKKDLSADPFILYFILICSQNWLPNCS